MPTCSESQWLLIQVRLNRTRSDHSHHPDCSRICHWYNLEKRAILGKLNSHLIRTLLSLHASCSCDWSNTLKPLYIKTFFPLYRLIICVGATDVSFIDSADNLYLFFLHPLSINKKTHLTSPLCARMVKTEFYQHQFRMVGSISIRTKKMLSVFCWPVESRLLNFSYFLVHVLEGDNSSIKTFISSAEFILLISWCSNMCFKVLKTM